MDKSTTRVLTGFGIMLVACVICLIVIRLNVPPLKKQRVILDPLGCQAAKHLGLEVKAIDSGVCEIEEALSVGLA